MIYHKEKGVFNSVTMISKNFDCYNDYEFIRKGNEYEYSFLLAEIKDELGKITKKINEAKNELDSIEKRRKKEIR